MVKTMKPLPIINEIFLWVWIGLMLWGNSYIGQRNVFKNPSQHKCLRIQVPGWIALLCGKPSPANHVEIGRMVSQLGALVMSVLWLPLMWMGVEFEARMSVFIGSILLVLLLGFAVNVVGDWWTRQSGL